MAPVNAKTTIMKYQLPHSLVNPAHSNYVYSALPQHALNVSPMLI